MAHTKIKKDLTTGPLLPKIILFSLPLIATAILQQLFNTADTVVVGRWGGETAADREAALAAVGSCGALTNLIVTLFFGLSVGAGVCVAGTLIQSARLGGQATTWECSPGRSLCLTKSSACGRLWQFAHPRPLSLLQRGLAPRSKGKARAELRPARRQARLPHSRSLLLPGRER